MVSAMREGRLLLTGLCLSAQVIHTSTYKRTRACSNTCTHMDTDTDTRSCVLALCGTLTCAHMHVFKLIHVHAHTYKRVCSHVLWPCTQMHVQGAVHTEYAHTQMCTHSHACTREQSHLTSACTYMYTHTRVTPMQSQCHPHTLFPPCPHTLPHALTTPVPHAVLSRCLSHPSTLPPHCHL